MLRELVLVGIGAIFGLGATMAAVAAPSHFPNTPPWVWHWLFWGGIALMALMIVNGFLIALWRPQFWPAVLSNVGVLFLTSAAIAQFSPHSAAVPPKST